MKTALIDLGSNTIKYSVYEVNGSDFSFVCYDVEYAYIISCVENDLLSEEGVLRIVHALRRFEAAAKEVGCEEIVCFSTASLRYIKNRDAVIDAVYEKTGLRILPISGEEEAHYNALSMKLIAKSNSFSGADLGGGSLQLFSFEKDRITARGSLALGALKLYKEEVKGRFPTVSEQQAIRARVRQTLAAAAPIQNASDPLYFMGGSVRMMAHLIKGCEAPFAVDELEALLDCWNRNPKEAERAIAATVPERAQTIWPAMLVVLETAAYLGIHTIYPTTNSVREGYLMEYCRRKKEV